MYRTAISSARTSSLSRVAVTYARPLHFTAVTSEGTVTDKVKGFADAVNKKMGKGLASAIETGEKATETTKETIGSTTESAKQKADSASEATKQTTQQTGAQAQQKANQAASGARQAKSDFQREVSK